MSDILLSIIIPTYNCEDYVAEGLDSVLSQLPSNCELIVVDDGSEDGTRHVLSSYENSRNNLRIIYRPHGGASPARNAGLDAANGSFVSFMDCDDCLKEGFLKSALPLLQEEADLYIFGIERIPLNGHREYWTVKDRVYPMVSDFADDYIRTHALLIYSNCNKFYRRSVIEEQRIRFDEAASFGEDRLFNYDFLKGCKKVITSSLIMLNYLQRSLGSLSSKHFPGFFKRVLQLHKAKMFCFIPLSEGTSREEKQDFIAYDLASEISNTINRFEEHPEETEENLPLINSYIFDSDIDQNKALRTQPDSWYKHKEGRAVILNELQKLVRLGYIPDERADAYIR